MNICRVCMVNGSSDLLPIFSEMEDTFIANIIVDCASVEILEDDGLPTVVCRTCIDELKSASAFVTKCRESDRKLRKMFKTEVGIVPVNFPLVILEELPEQSSKTEPEDEPIHIIKKENIDDSDDNNEDEEEEDFTDDNDPAFKLSDDSSDSVQKRTRASRSKKYTKKAKTETENDDDLGELSIPVNVIDINGIACCGCLQIFDTDDQMKEHSKTTHSKKRRTHQNMNKNFACVVCYKRFDSERLLNLHTDKMKEIKKLYECSQCNNRFKEKKFAKFHIKNHPGPRTKRSFVKNVEKNASFGKLCCAQACGKAFETEELLIKHAHTTHEINKIVDDEVKKTKPIECHICFKRFANKQSLTTHQSRKYKDDNHQCTLCGLKFRSNSVLLTHERTHTGDRPFVCDKCPKRFYSKEILKAHMLTHSEVKPWVCSDCGWAFVRKKNWQVHCLTHTDEFLFKCNMCPSKFKSKPPLQYHMRTHTGERPYKCRYCEKAFADHTNRQRHEMSHTGIKPYKCTYCDKTFIRKRFQVEHESTHTGIRPYKCDLCPRMFSQKMSLKKHLESHPEYRQAMMMAQMAQQPEQSQQSNFNSAESTPQHTINSPQSQESVVNIY